MIEDCSCGLTGKGGEIKFSIVTDEDLRKYNEDMAAMVEALKRMPELAYQVLVTKESSIRPIDLAMELQIICDAALTGTGEK